MNRPTFDEPRRDALRKLGAAALLTALANSSAAAPSTRKPTLSTVCLIRYEIDPFQREAFKQYAATWGRVIPRCGGHLIGYFMPSEGTNFVAWALIAFDSLASYERYRARLRVDRESLDNFAYAQGKRMILKEERTFLEIVPGTFERPVENGPAV